MRMKTRVCMLTVLAVLAAGFVLSQGQPASSDHRLAPAAHALQQAADTLLDELIQGAHHEGERHEGADEVKAIMAGGAIAGQAKAFHELLENSGEPNVRAAAAVLFRSLATGQSQIIHAHVSRDVRDAWRAVDTAAARLDREMGGGMRRTVRPTR